MSKFEVVKPNVAARGILPDVLGSVSFVHWFGFLGVDTCVVEHLGHRITAEQES